MYKFSAVFISLILSMNIVSSLKLKNIDSALMPSLSTRTQLTQMLIEVQQDTLKTGKQFLDQIEGLVHKLQEEQEQHQNVSNAMTGQCGDEISQREKAVAEAKDALSKSHESAAKCKASYEEADSTLPDLEKTKSQYEIQLSNARTTREEQHSAYVVRQKAFQETIDFARGFDRYLESLDVTEDAPSFIQKTETLLKHSAKVGALSTAVPIFITLSTVRDRVNRQTFEKLVENLQALLDKLVKDNDDNEITEHTEQENFSEFESKLNSNIQLVDDLITKLKNQRDETIRCQSTEEQVQSQANEKLNRNVKLLDAAYGMCGRFSQEFVDATKSRREELVLINEIIGLIESRFGKIPDALFNYLKNVQESWRIYSESAEFHKFQEFAAHH